MCVWKTAAIFTAVLLSVSNVSAGEADVVAAEAFSEGGGSYRFSVTVKHADEGWNHYADRWEVLTPDGKLLGVRTLYHPHVNEYGGAAVTLELPR